MPTAPVQLRDGRAMPALAWGTGTQWFNGKPADLETPSDAGLQKNVAAAIEEGVTHIDCAEMYSNEVDVGVALKAAVAARGRDALWVTSKVANASVAARDVRRACEATLRRLSLSYLDLYLVRRL